MNVKERIGILLLQRDRAFYRNLSQTIDVAARAVRDHEVELRNEYLEELSPQKVAEGLNALAEASDIFGVVAAEHPCGFELLEARTTFETASIAREVTERLLEEHPDLVGLYVSGGGITGAAATL